MWWLAVLLILVVFVSMLASAGLYILALVLALISGRWQPAAFGLIVGGVTLSIASQFSLPPTIRSVCLQLVAAAVSAVVLFINQDWPSLSEPNRATTSNWQTVSIGAFGVVGFILGAMTGVGKSVLRGLGQDVIGTMPSEQTEIAIAGGCVGAIGGMIVGVLVVAALWPPKFDPSNRTTEDRDQ